MMILSENGIWLSLLYGPILLSVFEPSITTLRKLCHTRLILTDEINNIDLYDMVVNLL